MSADTKREAVELKRATLPDLPASVRRPAYDPAAVTPGIVHLGLGGFHRAHMARYTHDLLQLDPSAREWGIAGESSAALLDAIDDPSIRIVSLTVTENGYCLDPATKRLNPEHPLIRADLSEPVRPRSAIGIIVEALRRRRAAGRPPFTALTCDNIQANGEVLREAVLALARLRGD